MQAAGNFPGSSQDPRPDRAAIPNPTPRMRSRWPLARGAAEEAISAAEGTEEFVSENKQGGF